MEIKEKNKRLANRCFCKCNF